MSKVVKGARFISKITEVTGVEPTIPPNDDHTLGWSDTDIYVGEWFWNVTDAKIFFRDNNGISTIVTPDPLTGQIDPSLLPGNYVGAMVYRGVWDASNGNPPGIPYGRLTPEKGDYYIVNVSGNTNLDGETDWKIGDYPIYNGLAWDKIDNSEPTIYSNAVLYDRVVGQGSSPDVTLTNVDDALDLIFDDMFDSPSFYDTVTIDDSTLTAGKTLLQLNGSIASDKWVNWNGTVGSSGVLGLGTIGQSNSILKIGPKGEAGYALTSTLNIHWTDNTTQMKRWVIDSGSNSSGPTVEGFIQGYADDGATVTTRISASGDTYFNTGNFGIGTVTPSSKLHVVGDIRGTGQLYIDTILQSTDTELELTTTGSGNIRIRPSGVGVSTSESVFDAALATIGTPLTVMGLISGSTADITGNINAGSATIVGNIEAASASITGTGTTLFYGKASYADYSTITIDNLNDITHKSYVDDEIANHAIGWWASGTTQTPTLKDVVLHNSTIIYNIGINKLDPTFNLDVVGNASITGAVNVGSLTSAAAVSSSTGLFMSATSTTTLGSSFPSTIQLRPGGVAQSTWETSFTTTVATIGTNTTISGSITATSADINGGIDVSTSVNLGSAATNEVVLRGNTVTIANGNGATPQTDGMNLMFAGSSAFGNQVMGMQPQNSHHGRSLTIQGQSQSSLSSYNGGDLILNGGSTYGGLGGDISLTAGSSTTNNGGDISITAGAGGTGVGYDGGAVSITGGAAYTGGDINIAKGPGTADTRDGKIYIDHIINQTYKIARIVTGTINYTDVVPPTYNFINYDLTYNAGFSINYNYLFLGNLQLPNNDFMVTIQVYMNNTGTPNTCVLEIRKGTVGTTTIISAVASSGPRSGYFTAVLTWNHVKTVWTVASLAEENTMSVTTPNGNIV